MTISPWTVWLVAKMGAIQGLFSACAFISVAATGACLFWAFMNFTESDHDGAQEALRWKWKTRLLALFIFVPLAVATPNTKELAAIILIPAVVNNNRIQNISSNSLQALEDLTQDWVDALRAETLPNTPEESKP